MDTIEKVVLGIIAILAVAAIFLSFVKITNPGKTSSDAEILFFNMQTFGENFTDYSYVYNETSNNFPIVYSLYKHGNTKMIQMESHLSTKKIYFLSNNTIMCLDFLGNEECTEVKNETSLKPYLFNLNTRFFSNNVIAGQRVKMREGITKKYVFIDPTITKSSFNGKSCNVGKYKFDYTNISMQDMPLYGVYTGTPIRFDGKFCIDGNGTVYYSYFNYTYNGAFHEWKRNLISINPKYGGPVKVPKIKNSSTMLTSLFFEQKNYEKLANCYMKTDATEKNKCTAILALTIKSKKLCEYTEKRRDRCLLSITPLLLEESICTGIFDKNYKEDCYVELAGGLKKSTYCTNIANLTKKDFCLNISKS